MSALSIQPTYPIFTEVSGQPLEDGYVWVGQANLDPQVNPIAVYWDAALTIPAEQPIRTLGGYPSNSGTPARLYVSSDYSIRVMNKKGGVVYSAPSPTERFGDLINASQVVYDPSGTGAVQTNVQTKLRERVSVKDFGAAGDGLADDTLAIQNALNTAKSVYVPSGTYTVTGLNIPSNTELHGAGYTSHIKLKNGANSRMIFPADEAAIYTNIIISNLRLDGNAANQTGTNHHVIALRAYRQTHISNCWIEDAKGDGIIFSENTNSDDPLDFTVENCYIARSGRNGLSITAGQRFTLLNVFSYAAVSGANPGDGFDLETNSGQIIKDGKLIGCQAWGNFGRGFNFQANNTNAVERITVSDCHAHDNLGVAGFMLQSARYMLLNNCYSYNNTGDGFRLTLLAAANRFNNCLAQDNDAYGFIEVAGSSVNNNFFLHCFSDGNVSNTITLSGSGSVARHITDANGKDHHQLYVEGTTVPTIGGTVSNPSSVTYTHQFGWYTQVGDRVTINIKVGVSAVTGGSGGMAIDLTNVPLCANQANNDSVFQVMAGDLNFGAATYVTAFMQVNTRRIVLQGVTTAAALSNINIDPFTSIWITGSYRCAT